MKKMANVVKAVIAILAVMMVLPGFSFAGDQSVFTQFGTSTSDLSYRTQTDGDGNIYVAGDTGGVYGQTKVSQNGFLRKTTSAGALLWQIQIGSTSYDEIRGLAVANDGTAYVVGSTAGSINSANQGGYDLFVAKVSSAGSVQWLAQTGTIYEESGQGVTVDPDGNVYVCGWTMGTMDGTTPYNKYRYGLVMKYDSDGNQIWAKQFNLSATDIKMNRDNYANAIAYYSGNLYVTGLNRRTQPGNLFLVVFNTDGTFQWSRALGGENTMGKAIAVNATGIYITGFTITAFDGNAYLGGSRNGILVKYDFLGNKQWSKIWGTGVWDEGNDIAIDSENSVYVLGNTKGALFGQTAKGAYDAALSKFYYDGTRAYTVLIGTANSDFGNGLGLDPADNIMVTGGSCGIFPNQVTAGGYDGFMSARVSDTDAAVAYVQVTDTTAAAPLSEVLATVDDANSVTIEQASTGTDGKFKIKSRAGQHLVYKEKTGYKSVNVPDQINLTKGISLTPQVVCMKKDAPAPACWTIRKGAAPYKVTAPPVQCSIEWFFAQAQKAGAVCTIRVISDGITLNRNNWKAHRWYRFIDADCNHAIWFDSTYTRLYPDQQYFITTNKEFTICDFSGCDAGYGCE